jgi:hypothetical protein
MLHLLPIRILVQAVITLVALAIVGAFYSGWLDPSDGARNLTVVLRFSSGLVVILTVGLVAMWRWIPGFQKFIFPYLGGRWRGVIRFPEKRR